MGENRKPIAIFGFSRLLSLTLALLTLVLLPAVGVPVLAQQAQPPAQGDNTQPPAGAR